MLNNIEPTKKTIIINVKETTQEEVYIKEFTTINNVEQEITKKVLIPKETDKREVLEFIFDLDSFLELERRYGSKSVNIFNQMLMRVNITNNFTKILACACKNKHITDDYLRKHLKINKQHLNLYTEITLDLMDGFIQESVEEANKGLDSIQEDLQSIEEVKKKQV